MDVETYVRTRESLHALAEHVLAAARFRATGKIGLRAAPGGFGTPPFGDGEQVRVDGSWLVHTVDGNDTRTEPATLRVAAEAMGIEAGAPDVYTPTTPLDLDRPLDLDPGSVRVIAWWYGLGAEALAALSADRESNPTGAAPPSEVQLWPEHFDLATDLGDPRANFGASPGDAAHPEPYLYVGPWAMDATPANSFWNEPFGASLGYDAVRDADDAAAAALAFFRRGRDLLAAGARES